MNPWALIHSYKRERCIKWFTQSGYDFFFYLKLVLKCEPWKKSWFQFYQPSWVLLRMVYDVSSKPIHCFIEEIYTHCIRMCTLTETTQQFESTHSDADTSSQCTWTYTNPMVASTIICNQIQRACKRRKHKEIIEYCLKWASLNACAPLCCFEGVIHWRWRNLASRWHFCLPLFVSMTEQICTFTLQVPVFLLMGFGALYL